MNNYFRSMVAAGLLLACCVASPASAESIRIVALGASNTNGVGVGASAAWPAQLERLLRAKGYDVQMSVDAVNGQDSGQILARTSGAIVPGTQVVVFDNGGDNDRRHGLSMAQTNANVARIMATIRAHHAVAIRAPYRKVAGEMYGHNGGYQMDGHHMTAQSHARVAAALLPRVIAAAHMRK